MINQSNPPTRDSSLVREYNLALKENEELKEKLKKANRTVVINAVPEANVSDETRRAASDIDDWKARRPGEYYDSYKNQIANLSGKIANRNFSYDAESDPASKQYRHIYEEGARLAMEDALGKALALTGGYGNSYAAGAAQQEYGRYMEKYADIIPELYEAAWERYSDEGDSLRDQLKILNSLSDSEWKKYSDALENYLSEGKILMDNYEGLSKADTERFLDYVSLMAKYG